MKMLRQAIAKAQDTNMVLALEAQVNELRELTASIPEYQELSQNLSLESVVNHIRSREAGVPQVIEKFSLRTMALENDGLIFAGVLAVIAAITALIMRFTNWLGGGRSSSSGGGGGGSTTFTTSAFSYKGDNDYLARAKARAAAQSAHQKTIDDLDEALRKMRQARYGRDSAHTSGPKAAAGAGKKTGPTIRNINDVLNLWLKDPENKDTPLYKFLKNTDPMYQEISEKGPYYSSLVKQEKLNESVNKRMLQWPASLSKATDIIKKLAGENVTETEIANLDGQMIAVKDGLEKLELGGTGSVTLAQSADLLDSQYEKAFSRTGEKHINFQDLNSHFFSADIIHVASSMMRDLDEASSSLKGCQSELETLQTQLRTIADHPHKESSFFKSIGISTNSLLDEARRDIMAYVRYIHHIKRFTNTVKHMDAEMVRANAKVIHILRDIVVDDPEDRAVLNAARKALEESMTINS